MLRGVRVRVGTSGWQYRHWRGPFYPRDLPTTAWLGYYAATFSTVEVNASFYRLPRAETVRRWAQIVPDDFVLTFKASRYLTHVRRLLEPEEPLTTMWEVFAAAGDRVGPVLFQFPPTFRADLGRLRSFLEAMPPPIRGAFEFRHRSWDLPEVARALDDAGCALVHADRPGVSATRVPTVGGWAYLRFHEGRRSDPGYEKRKLRAYAQTIGRLKVDTAYAYFNNDTAGAAIRDARTLIELLAERGVDVA